ncbi:ABC transporter family substrate-binding protein [Leucobacter sp. M11]|uniref:ABC transporter family substrate-binding protein n=1 Tax=Leucobacter sp. M11 TaxID=2993565 RepID=UPI002D80915E|nr:ABC transporter family substrate-binding protein [Leucobacter sp. M11]MEB4613617.1 ABC transporter family substrate-binding protein [Leucobacter sp. M11]
MRSPSIRRTGTALLAVSAIVLLGGCSAPATDSGGGGGSGGETGDTITIATTNPFTSLNGNTPQGTLDTNDMVGYLTGSSAGYGLGSFRTLDPEYQVVAETGFGTVEKLSDEPLTVKYTLNEDLTWSDGEPITADDLLFAWVQSSGWFDDAVIDPDSGEPTSGTQYFSLSASTTGYDLTEFPVLGDDNRSMTLTYSAPYSDWELLNPIGKPAHVVAEQAGVSVAELTELFTTLPKGDPKAPAPVNPTLRAAADFWNTGYDVSSMPEDPALLVGSGPFVLTDFVPEQSITLSRNPEYRGDHAPAYENLVIRFIGDANAQITALRNQEVDAIYPQASADTLVALEQANAEMLSGDQVAYDHLDLNFRSETFADADVREAFLKTIPRQQILDAIVTPVNPEAEVLNSQIFLPANAEYADAVAASDYARYDEPDIAGAKRLLAGKTPTVKILYSNENPNRVDAFQMIQASAAEAGFEVVDGGDPNWASLLGGGEYDASLFGWVSPGAGSAMLPQFFKTGGGSNFNAYANPEVDQLVDQTQVTLDAAKLAELKIKIDTATRADGYGLPLFQLPGVFATTGTVNGLEFFGGQAGIVWNAQDWTLNR